MKTQRIIGIFMLVLTLIFAFSVEAWAASPGMTISGKTAAGVMAFLALGAGMALATNTPNRYELGEYNDLPVAADTKIYEGSAVGENGSGYMRPLTAGDPFVGFAEREADNTDGALGAINVHLIARGKIVAAFTSIAVTNIGAAVYMSDDSTFTLTPGSNTYIGILVRYISATSGVVAFSTLDPVTASESVNNSMLADNAVDTDQLAADAVTAAKIEDDAVSIEHLDDGILPSHVVKFAGTHQSSANGGGVNALTVTGVAATDIVQATMKTKGASPVTLLQVVPTTNTLTFTFSGDPSTDHYVFYTVFRAGD